MRALVRYGVEIVAVGDLRGARVHAAVGRLLVAEGQDGPGIWDELLGAVKALRWRLVTQPQPAGFNPGVRESAERVQAEVGRMRGAVVDDSLLDDVAGAAVSTLEAESPVGNVLLRSIEEVGPNSCVVVAESRLARAALEGWLAPLATNVVTTGELDRARQPVDAMYVVGPPRLYSAALVTAPVASEITFLMPEWIRDHDVPQSAIAQYAEGAVRINARVHTDGEVSELKLNDAAIVDELRPQPVWGQRISSERREPASDEVSAHKVLLSGGHALWLDDGDRIRSLDPLQPPGERVTYVPVEGVRDGTYLLVRQGETEHGALYQEAMNLLGRMAGVIDRTQQTWKQQLASRLLQHGYRDLVRQLKGTGVRTADRARAWIDPYLIRPLSDRDFQHLLQWLDIPVHPTIEHANALRRKHYQASADIREQLETAVSAADLADLEDTGHLSLEVQSAGVRGILAARVLAVSQFAEIVPRRDTRLPFEDASGRWLE